MKATIDTNILLHLLRNSRVVPRIQQAFSAHGIGDTILLSIVSVGEIESIALQRNYGMKKQTRLKQLLQEFLVIPIKSLDLVEKYAEIDAYSQGNLADNPLPDGMSARNMGKNDLWIAATAAISNSVLFSTDKDLNHLDGQFLQFVHINQTI